MIHTLKTTSLLGNCDLVTHSSIDNSPVFLTSHWYSQLRKHKCVFIQSFPNPFIIRSTCSLSTVTFLQQMFPSNFASAVTSGRYLNLIHVADWSYLECLRFHYLNHGSEYRFPHPGHSSIHFTNDRPGVQSSPIFSIAKISHTGTGARFGMDDSTYM